MLHDSIQLMIDSGLRGCRLCFNADEKGKELGKGVAQATAYKLKMLDSYRV